MAKTRIKIAEEGELESTDDRLVVEVEGREIGVFQVDGEYHAVANFCVHQGGPLCEGSRMGEIEVGSDGWSWEYASAGTTIVCPWHNWRFDIPSGRSLDDPRYRVPTYEVEVVDGDIYVIV